MNTRELTAESPDDLKTAEELLRAGGVVAVPTETVYGLAADAANPDAVAAIYAAKERPANHPLIVHLASVDNLAHWAVDIPADAYLLAEKFWPGPLTLLLKKAPHVPSIVTGGLDTIGIRVPNHPVLNQLLVSSGLGLAAPSANPYKQLSPTSASQVTDKLAGKIDGVLDGGECSIGLESTIVDLSGSEVRILRAGPIAPSAISDVLGKPVTTPTSHQVAVPGNVQQHYQPRTPLYLMSRPQLLARMKSSDSHTAFVVLSGFDEQAGAEPDCYGDSLVITMPAGKAEFAQSLYRTLHDIDGRSCTSICFEMPPDTEEWLDVNDRLRRASCGDQQ